MASSPEDWYKSLPKITRGYMTASMLSTVAVQLGIISPMKLYLDFGAVIEKFEVMSRIMSWVVSSALANVDDADLASRDELPVLRPVRVTHASSLGSEVSLCGVCRLPFCFSMFFLIRYGQALEGSRFEGRAADMIWCMVITGLVQIAVAAVIPAPFLAQAMLEVIVYLWSREFSTQIISIFGLFSLQAFYFPWVLCAMTVLMGGSPVLNLVGIFAGHVYYFLEDIQGIRLKAPAFLSDYLDQGGVQARENQNRTFGGGHNWGGGGQRLGN